MSALLNDLTIDDSEASGDVKPDSDNRQALLLAVALVVTAAVWAVLFVIRVQAHQINVDDYAYAKVARSLIRSDNPLTAFLHTGSTSPLVPALAAPGAAIDGVYGAMTVELPFLLVLVAGSYCLARLWISPLAAMVAALVVALNEDVSSYSVMLHFAVPTAAALVWAWYACIRSRHFRDWRWSLIFGVAIAAMLLSRSMSIVYVVPLVAVAGIDLIVDVVKNGNVLRLPALGAVGIALVLAGPWWLVSGHAATHYLQNAGYEPSSGFTSQGAALNWTTIEERAAVTLGELGWGESWALGIALVGALWVVIRHHRTLKLAALWMLALWVVLTSLILSSSSNHGTGFGLPVIVILILLAAAVLGQTSLRICRVLTVAIAGVLTVGLVGETTGNGPWWPVAPYRQEVLVSGGNFRTNPDLINAQVARLIGSSSAVLGQESDILNANGILWNEGSKDTPLALLTLSDTPSGTDVAIRDLARAKILITGTMSGAYNGPVDQAAVESAAVRQGFRVTRLWLLGQGHSIAVWQRGGSSRTVPIPPNVTTVVSPNNGSRVRGNETLIATASNGVLATTHTDFEISGMGQTITRPAIEFDFLWIGKVNTTTLPNGSYAIRSLAVDAAGNVARSKPVTFRIDN